MGTGGRPKHNAADDSRKLRAIETLARHGSHASEWHEAGLLNAIIKVLDGHGTSADDLKRLMKEAKEY